MDQPITSLTTDKKDDGGVDIVVLNFADSEIPEFKEVKNKDWILYGERNDYPAYLEYLYNKSTKHNAIVNGKCNYIFGGGLKKEVDSPGFVAYTDQNGNKIPSVTINKFGETMGDLVKKANRDVEIYGGYYFAVVPDLIGRVKYIYHIEYNKIRKDKESGFWYKEDWADRKEEAVYYETFNPYLEVNKSTQIFCYNEYRPGQGFYPLPNYIGSCNYIEVDIEIGKFHLSTLRNGMMPSKLVQFYTGEPTEQKKKDIEKRFRNKFAGANNAGKFILVFNTNKEKTVDISDVSFNDLDKQFEILNKTTEQQIITGHQVVSPMLFGIKTEGQLGGTSELKVASELFTNTYAKPKQEPLTKVVNYFGGLMGYGTDYYISQLDPVGLIFDVKDIINQIPVEYIFEKLNIDKKYLPVSATQPTIATTADATNEFLRSLTGRQHQQLMRVIKQYGQGKLTLLAATAMLKASLGLTDEQVKSILGVEEEQYSIQDPTPKITYDECMQMFEDSGDVRSNYHIVKSKKLKFSFSEDIEEDENEFYNHAYAAKVKVSDIDADILNLIKKDKRVTPEVIAETIGSSVEYVTKRIAELVDKGVISTTEEKIGDDTQIERTVSTPSTDIQSPDDPTTTDILIKYSYEVKPGVGPAIIETTRPFCKKMIQLDRLYSRAEIESISQRLGYSVWDRRGGWWGHSPTCRHRWVSHIVVRKKTKK